VAGFLWDVAWHITIGRDEFLFSPPHVYLLLGISLLALAGLVSISTATRDRADVGWRVDRWRIPRGGAVLLVAGSAALVAFGVDELWHWAYGLDVTMWSPPHLTMISCAALSPMAAWLLLAEAGPAAGHPVLRRHLRGFLAAAVLVGLSAWQLEFDLGVPQWQQLYHPVLVALAGGFALTAARAALGRGGALVVVGWFIVVRAALALLTVGAWGLSVPRFVPYAAGAVAVEVAFRLARGRSPLVRGLAAGAGMGTLGLAGAWAFTHVWAYHPWELSLLPHAWVAAVGAVAAGVLGNAFGRAVDYRPTALRPLAVGGALAVIALAVAVPLPRQAPAASAHVQTTPAGEGWVHVEVRVEPPEAVTGADRFEVMSWQGDGHQNARLAPAGDGAWVTEVPVPVSGEWKSMVRVARGAELGAVPVYLPADPEIGASAVPVAAERTSPFLSDDAVLLREATEGPAWPGVVGYAYAGGSVLAVVALLLAGVVGLERRRRGRGWHAGRGSLAGRRVLLTGAEGGIGSAARDALEAQGAAVVGVDLVGDGHRTLAADVRDPDAVAAAVDEAARRLGGLDTVIANAGIGRASIAAAMPGQDDRDVLDVNFHGAWHSVAAAARHLPADGQVVVVGSGLAVATAPCSAAYTASKRAVVGYADVLRLESDLTVSTVQPAYIRTPIHHVPERQGVSLEGAVRRETVTDAAAAIVTACETGRRELGSSPVTTAQLWLARHFPAATDRYIARSWHRSGASRPSDVQRVGPSV
jgi:NAD(P)-dependent dehydrogenase (short-subunit alcohol dehydrogenase family)